MDDKETALYFFRKLVYVLYLEIGSLTPRIHKQLAAKAYIKNAFFNREKEKQAAELYRFTETEETPAVITAPYIERTGLTLEDLERVFREGNWRNKFGGYTFGGPRWAHIAQVTLELRKLIDQGEWEKTVDIIYEIKKMKSNQTYLISHFERGDRRH
jgi:hypothetical protein